MSRSRTWIRSWSRPTSGLSLSLALGLGLGVGGAWAGSHSGVWASLFQRVPSALSSAVPSLASPQGVTVASEWKNWGLSSLSLSGISAAEAWKLGTGNSKVVVAVIDTGIDANHPALKPYLWKDPSISDRSVYGWDFLRNQPNPQDDLGHGTHIAGIIGGARLPSEGISGVAPGVSIMALKYYSEANTGEVNLANSIKAMHYAIDHGAKIMNFSGGGPEFSEEEYLALRKAEARGVLVVCAAGNEHENTDKIENYFYPAAYGLSNVISVAALDLEGDLTPASNWGKRKVHLAAPGKNILSLLPGAKVGPMSGTSQATAFVSGVAALLLSRDPSLTPQELKALLMGSVDRTSQLAERVASGGKLNAHRALLQAQERMVLASTNPGPSLERQPVSVAKARTVGVRVRARR